MTAPIDEHPAVAQGKALLARAYEQAVALVQEIEDPDAAFAASTSLSDVLMELHGHLHQRVRPGLMVRIHNLHQLDLVRLAEHVTRTGGRKIGKSRVHQLLELGTQDEDQEAA